MLAWEALNYTRKIWTSNLSRGLKKRIFVAAIEAILLYGCETWTLSGFYMQMQWMAFNIYPAQHVSNMHLYGNPPTPPPTPEPPASRVIL